jgi:hypothetical protein
MVQRTNSTIMTTLVPVVSTWTLGEARENSENAQVKTFPLSLDGRDVFLSIGGAISPFDLSSVAEGNARKSLTLRLPKNWDEAIECMESCLQHEMWERQAQKLFGREIDFEEFSSLYRSVSQQQGCYPRNLRAKVNTAGFHACRYWDSQRQFTSSPENLANYTFNARLHVRALWIGPDGWGLVLDATDLQIQDVPMNECPF